MITIRKLSELPPRTRLRKISRIARMLELRLRGIPTPDVGRLGDAPTDRFPDREFIAALFRLAADEPKLPAELRARAAQGEVTIRTGAAGIGQPPGGGPDGELTEESRRELVRALNDLHHALEQWLGHTVADWDFFVGDRLDASARDTRPISLYLDDLRSPFNVGAIFRAADAFGVAEIVLSPGCADPDHPRAARASMGAVSVIPWRRAEIAEVAALVPALFAVETGGSELGEFAFPEAGTAVLGSEELGVGPEALALADRSRGRVSIPMAGAKGSLNVAVAAGIVLYQWWRAGGTRAPH